MGKKGSEVSPSESYPLRCAHSSGRVLRSASTKDNKACSDPLNDSAAAQSAVKKRRNDSLSVSPNNSVRMLCSVSKNKNDACSEPLNDKTAAKPDANKRKNASPLQVGSPSNTVRVLRSTLKNKDEACSEPIINRTAGEPAANKRKKVSPSKLGSPSSSARVLRSASKYNDETCTEPLNGSTAVEPPANRRKVASPSNVGSPNNTVRVLRSALKNKNEASSEPLNDGIVGQPTAKRRRSGSALKVAIPVSSARVLRSTSERKNKACNELLNDNTAAQSAAGKRKGGTLLKTDCPKIDVSVLRSASGKKNDACSEPVNDSTSTSVQTAVRKRKSCRPSKDCSPKKDYVKICQRVRYILNRMNYQQSFIQAYASEGWKGQSLEKIRPEKELERAKAEILQCKLRIREAFRNMDAVLSEGKLEESLFDSAGEIYSEDIFCAICGSKDVTLQNDIILCDGACDRGFHQNCLKPPLLTEDIPPGDEGWLCPACVCKADSIVALNELQGSKLSIHDSWEKVFPEAASLANDSKQVGAFDLPPDRKEDNDYTSELAEGHMMNEDRFSAEDDDKVDDLGLPSEDSEDDDFDPAAAGPDYSEDPKNELNSEESDFTSDSDDFCAEIAKSCGQDEVSASPLLDVINHTDRMKMRAGDNHSNEGISNRAFIDMELEQVLPILSRRQVERLNYKKLYDEAYGKESSESSDDEEWSGKELLEGSETDSFGEQLHPAKRCSRRAPAVQKNNEHTPRRERLHGSEIEEQTEVLRSNGSSSTGRKFGPIATQKLKVHFEKDPYPSRATRENLAQELGLTFNQVCRWFSSTRHYSRVASAKKEKHPDNNTSENNDSKNVDSMQTREPNAGVMEKLSADRNVIVPEKPMVQNNLNQCNKEDMPFSGTEIEMESYGQESSDSSDEEWSAFSTPRKARLQDNEIASPVESLRPAKRCSRRAPAREQNNEHTPQSEQLHGSASEQRTEVLCSNNSSSKASKYHFGPIVSQKLKAHFEKDPYPSRATKESLAQELGLTFNQVGKWFSATRYYSRGAAAKNKKHPGKSTTENDNSTTFDGVQVREPNVRLMEKPAADINDMISEKLMIQINLNDDIEEDIPPSQYTRCEEGAIMTPHAISREVGLPGYGPGENFLQVSSRNSCEQNVITTPPAILREVGPPGYVHGENQGNNAPWNTSCEQIVFMTPTTISREIGPPGYGPEENQGNGISWNMSCEQGVFLSSTTISRKAGPPGYGSGENQGSGSSWNTSCEQGMFISPATMSREAGLPGYGPGENQGNGTSPNTSCELRMFTSPTAISREVGLPGYEPGENQDNGTSWNMSYRKGVSVSPTATEVCPPGFGPGENQGSGTSWNMMCEQRMYTSPATISREAGPPGYGGENQSNGASWTTSYEQGVFTSPMAISREVRPPGYGPGENQGNSTSWIASCKLRMFASPTTDYSEGGPPGYSIVENQGTGGSRNIDLEQRAVVTPANISREVFPPGYEPGENHGSGASGNFKSPQGRSAEKVEFSDEARKKAIQRELRRRQKFR